MSDLIREVVGVTGTVVWLCVGLFAVVYVFTVVVPNFISWACYVGYCAFGDKAEKDELRRLRQERARKSAKTTP